MASATSSSSRPPSLAAGLERRLLLALGSVLVVAGVGVDRWVGAEVVDVRALRLGLVVGGLAAFALLAVVVRWIVRRGLEPLRAMNREVEALDAERLGEGLASTVEELAPLGRKLDDLLARLQAAFVRERRFSSDVAHELRTPIAELRSLADVGGRWPGDEQAVRGFFADVALIAGKMERLVVHLLALARAEAGADALARERLELKALVETVASGLEREAAERDVTLRLGLRRPLWLTGDPDKLHRLLQNVLGNAVVHGQPGGTVEVAVEQRSRLVLAISNRVVDLEPADLDHLFERFWRKDSARSGDERTGLGLPLVAALARQLDLEIAVALEGDRFTFRVGFAVDEIETVPLAVAPRS